MEQYIDIDIDIDIYYICINIYTFHWCLVSLSGLPAPGGKETCVPVESGPSDVLPVRPDWDRLLGRQHVSAGAHCGQPAARGAAKKKNNTAARLNHRPVSREIIGGRRPDFNTRCVFVQARGILEVTPVRQLVSLKWNLYGKHYFRWEHFATRHKINITVIFIEAPSGGRVCRKCMLLEVGSLWHHRGSGKALVKCWNDDLTAVIVSLSPTRHQAAAVTVPPVHRHLHLVLCISPSKGRARELHKVWHGQNHPSPEGT